MDEFQPDPSPIKPATLDDLSQLREMIGPANEHAMEKTGLPAWKDIDGAYRDIENRLRAGEVFIIRNQDGEISSTITLSEASREWGESGNDGQALYFTKFMKDPNKATPDEALKLLRFAAQEAQGGHKLVIRCDAVADQEGMVTYYKKLGFVEKGRLAYDSSHREGILLEISTEELAEHIDAALTAT